MKKNYQNIVVVKHALEKRHFSHDSLIINFDVYKSEIFSGKIYQYLLRYKNAILTCQDINLLSRPLLHAIILRLTCTGACFFEDESGLVKPINICQIFKLFVRFFVDYFKIRPRIAKITKSVDDLTQIVNTEQCVPNLNASGEAVYLRTDCVFGLKSGGSVAHTAGVLNELARFSKITLISTDYMPLIENDIPIRIIKPLPEFLDYREPFLLNFNSQFYSSSLDILKGKKLSFIYQRYSLNNFSGLQIARHFRIPFVLEFNGSEIWIGRNWAQNRLRFEALAHKIELLNCSAANLIIAVSKVIKEQLVSLGVHKDKILVNPNGVDPNRYSPDVDNKIVRDLLGVQNKIVIGFIGTFGPWHGAEILAEAFGSLLKQFPLYKDSVRLLLIGTGERFIKVKECLGRNEASNYCIMTGQIPQESGPGYMAACDILVSPHVQNLDQSKFFGSPTKLFEYMAMGKGIVASDLEQISDILTNGKTALLSRPGDIESLASCIKALIDFPDLRKKLGDAARMEVVEKYTWKTHTQRIIEQLKKLTSQ